MPVWTEEELQVVGRDMRLRMDSGSDLFDFFDPLKISERCNKYGGIFRFVLTTEVSFLRDSVDNKRSTALEGADLNLLNRYVWFATAQNGRCLRRVGTKMLKWEM